MKTIASIFIYGVWFGFVLWLSYFDYWFLFPIRWVQDHLLPHASIPNFYMTVVFLLWFALAFSLAWLPIWLGRKWHFKITGSGSKNLIFVISLFACTLLCAFIWSEFIFGRLYLCTDPLGCDFLHPGDWVAVGYVTVPRVNPNDSMNMPDSIKQGWSVPKLWLLWWVLVAVSVAISASLSFLIFPKRKSVSP